MKAKRNLLIGLAALLALLALGAFAAGRLSEAGTDAAADEGISLADWSAAEIERFGIEYGGQALTFVKVELPAGEAESEGAGSSASGGEEAAPRTEWQLEGEAGTALDQSAVSTMLTSLSSLRADRALEENREEYGLSAPTLAFWVQAKGATHSFAVGAENPVTGSVYLQKDGGGQVYLVAASRVAGLQKTKAELSEQQPAASEAQSELPAE